MVFADGTREEVDVVVYCTGYKISFPFLDAEVLAAPDNQVGLFARVFPLPEPGRPVPALAVVGLVQPLGAIMPLAEEQGLLVADWLRGRYALPAPAEMAAEVQRHLAEVRDRYVGSKRHTIQVDFDSYLHDLQVERRRGRKRAAAAGYPLPVPGRQPAAA